MTTEPMTPLERVLTTMQHREPDRLPFFLLVTMHGAREVGVSIAEYFADPEHVAEGQLRMRARYQHDCLYAFFYAAIEAEAWGGDVRFAADGPPLAGQPPVRTVDAILRLEPPRIEEAPGLRRVLRAIELMRARAGAGVPIIGVAIAPFSLPTMQLGFEHYLDLLYDDRAALNHLMAANEAYTVAWANAQLQAGATAICYFDPLASPGMVPPALYRQTGREVARRTIARINGPVVTHLASGRCLPIVDDLADTGTVGIATSVLEDLADVKAAARGRLTIVGNLDALRMRRWDAAETEATVRRAIAQAGPGGGFILSDNHGEIPWQVPETTLEEVAEAVHHWGRYPLDWVTERD